MKRIYLFFIAYLLSFSLATAGNLSLLYKRSTLEYWGARYQQSTNKILDQVIWKALLAKEKRRLGGRPVLMFPMYAEGEARNHPLNFSAISNRNTIVLPVFSLKFLDDLCTAYAWLQIKGYSLETISEYTALLFYGKPPPNGFPPPLEALGIPEDALKDRNIDELALAHFVTARTFILLHEMGHNLYHHRASTSDESIRNEQQADRFAAEVMQRTPLPPLGMLVWFMADAHWTGFPPQRGTHPLSGERVRALADHIDDQNLAKLLRRFGDEFLDDPDIRAGFVATGKAGNLAALQPRYPGELPSLMKRRSNPSTPGVLFSGSYESEFTQFGGDPTPIKTHLSLERQGSRVTGHYSFGLGFGKIGGTVDASRLYFDWEWAGSYGRGVLKGQEDGSFTGTWGYRESRSGAGTWAGHPR